MKNIEKINYNIPYYEDNSRISNSSMGWFIKNGAKYFHEKLINPNFDILSTSALSLGTLIHLFLLQPEEWESKYIIFDGKLPQSLNQENFCKYYINSTEIEPDLKLIQAYKKSYKVINQNNDKILSQAKELASNLKYYIEILDKYPDKEIISKKNYKNLVYIQQSIHDHKLAKDLIYPKKGKIFSEFQINWEAKINCGNISCKSLLDRIIFDIENKEIFIIDLKTTSKIGYFEDSIKDYDYIRQIAYYKEAVIWYIENILKDFSKNWKFKYYIVAVSTSELKDTRVFELTEDLLSNKKDIIYNALNDIAWHIDNNKWEHNKEYYCGNGCETLKL